MRRGKWAIYLTIVATVTAMASPVMSQARDDDGTRMQARHVEMGTVHSDLLSPPQEEADWRMIRLDEDGSVDLELTVTTADRSATLRLTEATGDEIEEKIAGEDPAQIAHSLEAGIYYIVVESSQELSYELSIQ